MLAVMDEIVNKVRGENRRPGMKTLTSADDVFGGKMKRKLNKK
jgi:hypothetical protein